MADEENPEVSGGQKSKLPLILGGSFLVVALVAVVGFLMTGSPEDDVEVEQPPAEYVVKENMYQLKDGAYLRLAFSIVVDADKLPTVTNIIEKEAPGRLPAGITLLLGNKGREDLINGTHKREAFGRELKKMLEERVFNDYNRRQRSSKDMVEVREVLISDFVTQIG